MFDWDRSGANYGGYRVAWYGYRMAWDTKHTVQLFVETHPHHRYVELPIPPDMTQDQLHEYMEMQWVLLRGDWRAVKI